MWHAFTVAVSSFSLVGTPTHTTHVYLGGRIGTDTITTNSCTAFWQTSTIASAGVGGARSAANSTLVIDQRYGTAVSIATNSSIANILAAYKLDWAAAA